MNCAWELLPSAVTCSDDIRADASVNQVQSRVMTG